MKKKLDIIVSVQVEFVRVSESKNKLEKLL